MPQVPTEAPAGALLTIKVKDLPLTPGVAERPQLTGHRVFVLCTKGLLLRILL